MEERVDLVLDEQMKNLKKLREGDYSKKIVKVGKMIVESMKKGGKILIAGNGGSAADSQHFAAEIVGRFVKERSGYPAIALTTDTSILTAIGNDYGYDDIFARQIEALGNENDIFVGISTSGNSENVIRGVDIAKKKGLKVVGLLGKDGGRMKDICDESFIFGYSETARVQEHHLMTYHLLCEYIENELKEFYNE